jgi:hypothetical protein
METVNLDFFNNDGTLMSMESLENGTKSLFTVR